MPMDEWPRHDTRTHNVPAGRLDVYRRDDSLGAGWCMSLYVDDVEVMRFDLFPGEGHEHWSGLPGRPRLYYPRTWQSGQLVRLAASNLAEHAPTACALAGVECPPRKSLEAAARWAKNELRELL